MKKFNLYAALAAMGSKKIPSNLLPRLRYVIPGQGVYIGHRRCFAQTNKEMIRIRDEKRS